MALPKENVPLRFTILHSDLLKNGARREVLIYDENAPDQRAVGYFNVTLADPLTLTLPVAEALKLAERADSHVIMEFRQVNWQRESQEFE